MEERIMRKKYVLRKKLGEGSYSDVWEARCKKTNKRFALKVMKDDSYEEGKKEASILRKIAKKDSGGLDKHVLLLKDTFVDTWDLETRYCLVFDVCQTNFCEYPFQNKHIKELCSALLFLHSKMNICHGDLKPENLVLKDDSLYVIDFGSSFYFNEFKNMEGEKITTRYYRSPEVIKKLPINEKIDIWALGCVVYELWTGNILFNPTKKKNKFTVNQHHLYLIESFGKTEIDAEGGLFSETDKPIRSEYLCSLLDDYKISEFIKKCLQEDILARPSSSSLLEICNSW